MLALPRKLSPFRGLATAATKAVRIVEVGPRDGLQNEPNGQLLTTQVKVELIKKLAQSGLRWIEAGSFVSPKWMADTGNVLQALAEDPEIGKMTSLKLPVLIPNMKGMSSALAIKNPLLKEIAIFAAASETFSQKNTNCSIEESLLRLDEVCKAATKEGIAIRGYLSTVIGCPYEGSIDATKVKDLTLELLKMGCYEVSLGDTIGVGTAGTVSNMLKTVLNSVDASKLAVHFHDTYGQALANILVSLEMGIRTVDAAVAGLGGCPYAPGATGNVATEDVVYMLEGLNFFTGVDLQGLVEAGDFICTSLKRINNSRTANAILARRKKAH